MTEGSPWAFASGEVIQDRYRIVRELGEGGMGVVYEAVHVSLATKVAVKLLHSRAKDVVTRFEREARIGATLVHPNVCRTLDYGQCSKGPFLVMEHLSGTALEQDLEDMWEKREHVQWQEAVEIGLGICAGVNAAHQAGIIHRDLKPANVFLLGGRRSRESVKLLDFGIARSLDPNTVKMTATGAVIGTLPFMAPEQVSTGAAANVATDIYSLAATIYAALTNVAPYDAETFTAFIAQIATSPPSPPLAAARPDIPEALVAIIERAMNRDPERRHQTVRELEQDLSRFNAVNVTSGTMAKPISLAPRSTPGLRTGAPGQTGGSPIQGRSPTTGPLAKPAPQHPPQTSTLGESTARPSVPVSASQTRSKLPLFASTAVVAGLVVAAVLIGGYLLGRQGSDQAQVSPIGSKPPTSSPLVIAPDEPIARVETPVVVVTMKPLPSDVVVPETEPVSLSPDRRTELARTSPMTTSASMMSVGGRSFGRPQNDEIQAMINSRSAAFKRCTPRSGSQRIMLKFPPNSSTFNEIVWFGLGDGHACYTRLLRSLNYGYLEARGVRGVDVPL